MLDCCPLGAAWGWPAGRAAPRPTHAPPAPSGRLSDTRRTPPMRPSRLSNSGCIAVGGAHREPGAVALVVGDAVDLALSQLVASINARMIMVYAYDDSRLAQHDACRKSICLMSYCQCEFTRNPRAEPRQRRVGRRRRGRGRKSGVRVGVGPATSGSELSVKYSENHTPSPAKRRSSKRPLNLTNLGRASDETVVQHMAKYRSRTLRVTACNVV